MARYEVVIPIEAVRYSYRGNESDVKALVASVRDGFSSTNGEQQGVFRIYNGGPEILVRDGDWVVVLAGEVLTVSDAVFSETFTAVE